MAKFSFLASVLLATSAVASTTKPIQPPKDTAVISTPTSQGCFRSLGESLTKGDSQMKVNSVSSGACTKYCREQNKPVMALGPQDCYCGDTYPAKDDLVDDDKCDSPCPAYGMEACGSVSNHAFSVYNTGLKLSVDYYSGNMNDGSGDKDDAETTTATAAATTTNSSSTTATANSPPDGIATASGKADATTTPGFQSTQSASASATSGDKPSAGIKLGSSFMLVASAVGLAAFL